MLHHSIVSICLLSMAVLFGVACGKRTVTKEVSAPPVRTGGFLSAIPAKYYDYQPAISDDGTKVAFVSGRDSTDTDLVLRVYKVDWPAGDAPGEAVRLAAEDIGTERLVAMAPDGSQVAVIAVSDTGTEDIYVIQYADGAVTRLTDDGSEKSELSFSPDSLLLSWLQRAVGGDRSTVFVAPVAGGQPVQGSEDAVYAQDVFWMNADAGYQLGVLSTDPSASGKSLKTKTFASAAAAETATFIDLFSGLDLRDPSSGGGTTMVVRRLPSDEAKTVVRTGNFEEKEGELPYEAAVIEEPVVIGTGDTFTAFDPSQGESATKTTVSNDGTSLFFIGRSPYRCVNDLAGIVFGSTLVTATAGETTFTRHVSRTSADGGFEPAADVCETTRDDESVGIIDNKIVDVAVARAGNTETFRAILVSRFNSSFDSECQRKLGDPEIIAVDHVAGVATYSIVAPNPYTEITNDDRGKNPPCE